MASSSFSNPLVQSFITVIIPLAMMVGVAYSGLFDTLKVEIGFEHYAEKADSHLGPIPFPEYIKMPVNTVVNVGYVAVAFFWGVYIFVSHSKLSAMQDTDAYLLYVMVWMLALYGPVQLLRIVTQAREWAILDQWVTLPIFAWVMVMSKSLLTEWQPRLVAVTMIASILSYNLVFTIEQGFEVALLPHVVYAISSSWNVCCKYKPPGYLHNFVLGVLMCAGFVVLKVADFHLARYPPFQEFTGHFWSKVCDFLQAHFMLKVFTSICLMRGTRNLAKKLF